VFVKATGSATTAAAAVRDTIRGVAPGAEVDLVAPLESLVERATAQPRFTSRLVAAFGLLALALAAVSIYGTLTFFVSTHVREIGIKIAIGASSQRVLGDILRHALVPAGVGGAMGIGLALAIARAFRALLFGVEPIDAVSLAGGGIVLIAVALAAAAGPARRASAIEPAVALRAE
jgi:ABC-type antimicrobial peptide transport system permease subunit